MYSPFVHAWKFLRYYLTASNGHGHGIHSPFVYRLVREVLMDTKSYEAYQKPELYRVEQERNRTLLEVSDLGAGSVSRATRERTVRSIAKTSVKHKRYAALLFRLGRFLGATRVLEMGTSLGVTTMYLAGIPGLNRIVTMEGADQVADIARQAFRRYGFDQVELEEGDFDHRLPAVLDTMGSLDLAYVDGNHRKEPTLRYFSALLPRLENDGCIVFDDIHWSREMEEAWREVCADPRVSLSIDLHAIGLVFVRREQLEKQHFTIRF